MFGSFFVIWTLAFAVEMGVLMSPADALKSGPVLGGIVAIVMLAAAWVFVSMNQHGWESNRALAIGIGGGLGWFMMLNVWGIIWRMQKKTHPLDGGRGEGRADACGGGQDGAAVVFDLAGELLAVVPHAVFHGSGQPLHYVLRRE